MLMWKNSLFVRTCCTFISDILCIYVHYLSSGADFKFSDHPYTLTPNPYLHLHCTLNNIKSWYQTYTWTYLIGIYYCINGYILILFLDFTPIVVFCFHRIFFFSPPMAAIPTPPLSEEMEFLFEFPLLRVLSFLFLYVFKQKVFITIFFSFLLSFLIAFIGSETVVSLNSPLRHDARPHK